ncbi:chemotaxis protein CheC [Evansella sp. AB-P1]|uniref:chemotaxis protein CheC n=1 Tax=Evansella sp. AB-P1 TaxID=3037653 RepID=UPI00241D7B19|nr:chemotaxis protein CheC [Evansella sp. AB-P1]MDG5788167.1 chemotaxis protein CheC [Evansella sp. AB-P1]
MDFVEKIKPEHLDILKEVGNIGAGHAATALSRLLNKTIDMNVPAVKVVSFSEVHDLLGGNDAVVAAIFLKIEGDVPGNMFFMLPVNEASKLIQQLTGDTSIDFMDSSTSEIGISALTETGNILAGSYLSALSDFTSLQLLPTPPALAIDMPMAIISYGLIEISQAGDFAILIDTEINEIEVNDSTRTTGHFFLLPDPDSFEKLFKSLGVNVND